MDASATSVPPTFEHLMLPHPDAAYTIRSQPLKPLDIRGESAIHAASCPLPRSCKKLKS